MLFISLFFLLTALTPYSFGIGLALVDGHEELAKRLVHEAAKAVRPELGRPERPRREGSRWVPVSMVLGCLGEAEGEVGWPASEQRINRTIRRTNQTTGDAATSRQRNCEKLFLSATVRRGVGK